MCEYRLCMLSMDVFVCFNLFYITNGVCVYFSRCQVNILNITKLHSQTLQVLNSGCMSPSVCKQVVICMCGLMSVAASNTSAASELLCCCKHSGDCSVSHRKRKDTSRAKRTSHQRAVQLVMHMQ